MTSIAPSLIGHYRRADKLLLIVVWLLFVAALCLAPWYGTWQSAAWVGFPTALICTALAIMRPGQRVTRITMGAATMVFTALHIHQAYGVTELHFGVFVLLAVLLCYRDWSVIAAAAGVIAVHHVLFYYLQFLGYGTICFTEPGIGRLVSHAMYVVVESTALCYVAVWLHRDAVQAAELRSLVNGLSAGDEARIDLSLNQAPPSSAAAETLFMALKSMAVALSRVRQCTAFMTQAAHHMVTGSIALRQGTQDQSTEVDEMVSAMQGLTGIAATARQHAHDSAQRVSSVTNLTAQSNDSMRQAVLAMQAVDESTAKISEITSVIDAIAFQTNILALNASVEAAHAGEQGKGFAVVASEVRGLAQRCAQAASEIRSLIETSTAQIGHGNTLVGQAGGLLDKLTDEVNTLSSTFDHVISGSNEQATHLTRIEAAIGKATEVMRQNLHRAEKDHDSAVQLEHEVRSLTQAVSQFELGSELQHARLATR
jgi:methyl-accepting chemotaxis protein